MGVFSFLALTKKGGPPTSPADLEASLERLRDERKQVELIVDSHGQRRADALLSDAADADIVELDKGADLAHIRLERLELAELELVDRLERARDKANRERVAAEYERAASAIEEKAKALQDPINTLAAVFADLVRAIPDDTFLRQFSEFYTCPVAASPEGVARAILANAIYAAAPPVFEMRKCHQAFRGYGAGVERALSVHTLRDGVLSPYNKGVAGEECDLAAVTAENIIVKPLRSKARALRSQVETVEREPEQ